MMYLGVTFTVYLVLGTNGHEAMKLVDMKTAGKTFLDLITDNAYLMYFATSPKNIGLSSKFSTGSCNQLKIGFE